jgi:hypothetical protein
MIIQKTTFRLEGGEYGDIWRRTQVTQGYQFAPIGLPLLFDTLGVRQL